MARYQSAPPPFGRFRAFWAHSSKMFFWYLSMSSRSEVELYTQREAERSRSAARRGYTNFDSTILFVASSRCLLDRGESMSHTSLGERNPSDEARGSCT